MVKNKGFTLVELLVVMVIVGILSTVSVATFRENISKARVGITLAQLTEIEKVLKSYHIYSQLTEYYDEDLADPDGDNEVTIEDLNEYITSDIGKLIDLPLPLPPIGNYSNIFPDKIYPYLYDNDQDEFVCGGGNFRGALILIPNVYPTDAAFLNEMVDGDNDLNCGRVRFNMTGAVGKWQGNGLGMVFYGLADSGASGGGF